MKLLNKRTGSAGIDISDAVTSSLTNFQYRDGKIENLEYQLDAANTLIGKLVERMYNHGMFSDGEVLDMLRGPWEKME